MVFVAYKQDREIGRWMVYSIGGGTIKIDGREDEEPKEVYYLNTFSEISEYCEKNNKKIYDYVYETEGENIKEFLADIWKAMKASINYGLEAEGTIPGKLNLKKRAKSIYSNINNNETEEIKSRKGLPTHCIATPFLFFYKSTFNLPKLPAHPPIPARFRISKSNKPGYHRCRLRHRLAAAESKPHIYLLQPYVAKQLSNQI